MASLYPHSLWSFLSESHAKAIPLVLDKIANPSFSGRAMFRIYRKFLGWTQKQLADEMCTTVTSVSRWESGTVKISQKVMGHVRAIVIGEISKRSGPLWYLRVNDPAINFDTVTLDKVRL